MNTKSWSGAEIEQLIELYRNFFYIDLVGLLHTEMVYLPEDGHPSRY